MKDWERLKVLFEVSKIIFYENVIPLSRKCLLLMRVHFKNQCVKVVSFRSKVQNSGDKRSN